jgi:hypothetical protein
MSNFTFKVEKINRLEKAKIIVVGGLLLDGSVTTGSSAMLMNDKTTKIVIKGIVFGEAKHKFSQNMSLVIDLTKNKDFNNLLKEGNFFIGN